MDEITRAFIYGTGTSAVVSLLIAWIKSRTDRGKTKVDASSVLMDGLVKRVTDLEGKMTLLEKENTSLREERIRDKEEIAKLKTEMSKQFDYIATLQSYYEHMPGPAWMKDENGVMFFINAAYEREWGVSKIEYEGRGDVDVWGPEVAKKFKEHDQRVVRTRRSIRTKEFVPHSPGDEEGQIWIVWKFPIVHKNRILIGGIAIRPYEE